MDVPAGASLVVVSGRGNWVVMRSLLGKMRPIGGSFIRTEGDVLNEGMMPIPGQCSVSFLASMARG